MYICSILLLFFINLSCGALRTALQNDDNNQRNYDQDSRLSKLETENADLKQKLKEQEELKKNVQELNAKLQASLEKTEELTKELNQKRSTSFYPPTPEDNEQTQKLLAELKDELIRLFEKKLSSFSTEQKNKLRKQIESINEELFRLSKKIRDLENKKVESGVLEGISTSLNSLKILLQGLVNLDSKE